MAMAVIELAGSGVQPHEVLAVAREGAPARLSAQARAAMDETAAVVERLGASGEPAYGVSTGFGSLALTWIPPERRAELQRALVRSHAAGMGPPVEPEVVRAMMFLRARSLATGRSGARPLVADTILALLAAGLAPAVPEHGSLGASGDRRRRTLRLSLSGEGERGGRLDAAARRDALAAAGIEPLTLAAKEGLALINGTEGSSACSCWPARPAGLPRVADVIAALSIEALMGTDRPSPPTWWPCARSLARRAAPPTCAGCWRLGARGQPPPCDPACRTPTRCAAPPRSTARPATPGVRGRVARAELDAAIDNPVVLPDGRVESVGNFHGEPLAIACDFLAIAAAQVGAISVRRIDRLLDANRSYGLPPFLSEDAGVNSGLMLAQYTPAALVADNRRLARRRARTRCRPALCRRTTSRWAGRRPATCARSSDDLARILAVEKPSAPPTRSTCARRCSRRKGTEAVRDVAARGGARSRDLTATSRPTWPLPNAFVVARVDC